MGRGLMLAGMMLLASVAYASESPRLPPMPADAPLPDEITISSDRDPVAIRCANGHRKLQKTLKTRVLRIVVTKSPKWGTVWRADTAFPADKGEAPILWRSVCWKDGGLERPLEMFDPSESIPRLK